MAPMHTGHGANKRDQAAQNPNPDSNWVLIFVMDYDWLLSICSKNLISSTVQWLGGSYLGTTSASDAMNYFKHEGVSIQQRNEGTFFDLICCVL